MNKELRVIEVMSWETVVVSRVKVGGRRAKLIHYSCVTPASIKRCRNLWPLTQRLEDGRMWHEIYKENNP